MSRVPQAGLASEARLVDRPQRKGALEDAGMKPNRKTRYSVTLALCLVLGSALPVNGYAFEDDEGSAGSMIVDLVFLRIPGMVATAVGGVAFVLSLPFSAAGGNTEEAWQTLVVQPAQFTFVRPLGETGTFSDSMY